MGESRTYPEGVTSWVDIEQPDIEAAKAFYGGLFGWTFVEATAPGGAHSYVVAQLDGLDAAGIGGPAYSGGPADGSPAWNTYVSVDDADVVAARVEAAGGSRPSTALRRRRERTVGGLRRRRRRAVPAVAGSPTVGCASR